MIWLLFVIEARGIDSLKGNYILRRILLQQKAKCLLCQVKFSQALAVSPFPACSPGSRRFIQ